MPPVGALIMGGFEDVLVDELGVGLFEKMSGRVERAIMGAGPSGITRRDVLRTTKVGSDWLARIITNLIEKEQITKENGAGKTVFFKWISENENADNQHI